MSADAEPHRATVAQETEGLLLGLVGVAMFSLTLPATRIAVLALDPWLVAFGRMLVAAGVAGAYLLAVRAPWPARADLGRLAAVAAGVVLGFPLLTTLALRHVDAAHGAVVLAILPLATSVAGAVVARERPSAAFWAWAVLGAAIVAAFTLRGGTGGVASADLLLALACALAAMGYAVGGVLARRMAGLRVIAWALVLSLPIVLPVTLALLPRAELQAGPAPWLAFLYVALGSQFLGFLFWYKGLALAGVARVSQVQLLQPFLTIAASAVLLDERITGATLGFAAAALAVVVLGRRSRVRTR